MIKVNKSLLLDNKKQDLLSKLSIKIKELRNKGILVNVNGVDCYQKCRDEDETAMKAIIFSMESLGETIKHNYRMFNAQGYPYWCSPTLEELKTIQAQCFDWVSNILYPEIRRIETEILNLTVDNIDKYEINVEVM